MNTSCLKLLLGAAMIPASLSARENPDSIADAWEKELRLNEVVVVAKRPVIRQEPDKIVYMIQNDPYSKGLNGIEVLDRIPRVSVIDGQVNIAGKNSVRYIVDGHLLDMPAEAIAARLRNLTASGIEKIEVLTTPPAKYSAAPNLAFISITTRNESFGTKGNVWANGTIREDLNYVLGGNISHTARKIEVAADATWNDLKGINELQRTYTFADYLKTSDRTTRFTNRMFGANGLLKYKFSDRLNAGAIVNFSTIRLDSHMTDRTEDNGLLSESFSLSPSRPDNSLTLTAFADWNIDSKGKMLSLTYNYFTKHICSFSDVTTVTQDNDSRLTDEGLNKYHIHSAKIDAVLPFQRFKMEAGASFTSIGNNTQINAENLIGEQWIHDTDRSNTFDYEENTAAVYVSAEKSFSGPIFAKAGLRYEHTDVKGRQQIGNERHDCSYGYLIPSITLSWNNRNIGRFSVSYSMGLSRPNFADLNPFRYYTTTSDYVSGNPDLKPGTTHNAEINYSRNGIYAVLYNSYNHNSIGYLVRFNGDGSQYTMPENFVDNNKTGLYASCNRSLFGWWSLKVGGEVFYTWTKSKVTDFRDMNDEGWSGKVELNTTWMLNRRKTLLLNFRFTHMFPYHDRMIRYGAMSLIGADIRWMLLDNRLALSASVSDPFGWNITRSTACYDGYTLSTRNNIHSHAVTLRLSYTFGGSKVNNVYRDTKEHESGRSR